MQSPCRRGCARIPTFNLTAFALGFREFEKHKTKYSQRGSNMDTRNEYRRKQMEQESAENRKRRTARETRRISLTMYFASYYKSFSFLPVNTVTILAFRLCNLSHIYIAESFLLRESWWLYFRKINSRTYVLLLHTSEIFYVTYICGRAKKIW